jgi:hypothetical protein
MLQDIFDFIFDLLMWLPRFVYSLISDSIVYFFSLIPNIPLDNLDTVFSFLDSGLLYYLTVFQFNYALSAFFSAYIARFILRRIPFFGG